MIKKRAIFLIPKWDVFDNHLIDSAMRPKSLLRRQLTNQLFCEDARATYRIEAKVSVLFSDNENDIIPLSEKYK